MTDAVLEEARAWQNRPLERVYPAIYLDAIVCKVRHHGVVGRKAAYLAVGIDSAGFKDVLGIWIDQAEGAKFWLKICNELANRGVEDVIFVCVDGLQGLLEAIESVWPNAIVQTRVIHLIRASTRYASWKDRQAITGALKDLSGGQRASRTRRAGTFRGTLRGPLPRDRQAVARRVGPVRADARLPARDPPGALHHQHGQVADRVRGR